MKFNFLASRGNASGWPPNIDDDYYLRIRRDSTTAELSDTYYYDANRKINYPYPGMQLSLVKTSVYAMDIYLYREVNYYMHGSILFNKLETDEITTYTSEPSVTTIPENAKFWPVLFANVPTPPTSGTFNLQSVNGTLRWV
jgi:hypothetical protein